MGEPSREPETGMPRMRDRTRRLVWYWLPPVLWCAVIFIQSSFATPDALPSWPYVDKIGHGGVYALLALLFCRAFTTIDRWRGRGVMLFVAAVVATTLYGAMDEWHQSFVPARTADPMDLLADLAGAVSGASLFSWGRSFLRGRSFW
jgi:VanZ family protein